MSKLDDPARSPGKAASAVPTSVSFRALSHGELPRAGAILTEGMFENPVHVKVFGSNPAHRQRRLAMFIEHVIAYVHADGEVLGAYAGDELVALLGMIQPDRCRPNLRERLHFACAFSACAPPATLWRLQRWLSIWARNDPEVPHWHIGPLAVLPTYRRRGIARQLMLKCCAQMDRLNADAWLETDLEINVNFYRTLGFSVVRQKPVLGVPTWFMHRAPSASAAMDELPISQE